MPIARTSRLSVRASFSELDRWDSVARHLGHATTAHWIRALLTTSELAGDDGQKVGSELPLPLRTVLNEMNRPVLERFKKTYDAEFSALADPQELETWLNQRFDTLIHARQRRIKAWNTAHTEKKNAARCEIERLSALLITKTLGTDHRACLNLPRSNDYTLSLSPD